MSSLAEHPEVDRRQTHRLVGALGSVEVPLAAGLVALAVVFSLRYPETFATWNNLADMSRVGAILLVVATGQMFALLVGGFDLSVGANMGFASTVCALNMLEHGPVAGIVIGLLAATAVGAVNGLLVAFVGISPFVATLGTLTFIIGLGNQLSDGTSIAPLPAEFDWLGARDWGFLPATVCIATLVLVVVGILLNRTRVGLYLYSVGASREASALGGLAVARVEVAAYAASGALAGVAGLMLSSRVSVGQTGLGVGYDLMSIATAVIGGVAIGGGSGRLRGVLLGVAILTVLTTGLDIAGVSQFVQSMVTGIVLIAAVALDGLRRGRMSQILRVLTFRNG